MDASAPYQSVKKPVPQDVLRPFGDEHFGSFYASNNSDGKTETTNRLATRLGLPAVPIRTAEHYVFVVDVKAGQISHEGGRYLAFRTYIYPARWPAKALDSSGKLLSNLDLLQLSLPRLAQGCILRKISQGQLD